MSFSQWKPQEPSLEGQAFHKNQQVVFIYRKKQVVGTIIKLLGNSAVVTLSNSEVTDTTERTVVNYKNLMGN
ncbi:hypothetical protein AB1I55_14750 [Enterococcus entomosocium]|jgi:hypothetical protein|uniref:DUF2187 domain-containing protein n=1 Tax=Enterococcus entomosocium TaxID=3034352 RepID=A0ABV3MFX8_9ENTE|nr:MULTISPECIES: hypothetical protein [Enterococcus]AUJ87090.1 hypothetical protein CXM95_17230 [Enterococcus sp. CR-Ec1]MDB1710572.1 hypothetical protein [Enterococcus casseliflavus]MDB1718029.1 hypothetical protein [Enterococcus casseliflavus]